MPSLAENVASVQDRVTRAFKDAKSAAKVPRIVAVSKKQDVGRVISVHQVGLREFGENYLQEALQKIEKTAHLDICWHFIGPIQSNKTALIASHFDWVQSVDRMKIAKRLNEQRPNELPPLQICIQINVDQEASKSGIALDDAHDFAEQLMQFSRLKLRGIMCLPKKRDNQAEQLAAYQKISQCFQSLQQQYQDIDTLSLGMSGDLEAAINAGSTMVRIGTDIFGART